MNFQETINFVKQIPYGRNANRHDFSLVIAENKGTCSSKHAYLKEMATLRNIPNVTLMIGIYKMTESNTNIGSILSRHTIEYIPEAHCYLKIDGIPCDCTSPTSHFDNIKEDLLEEIEIEPYEVVDFKVSYHQNFLRKWLIDNNIKYTFEEIWKIRESCIKSLSI